MQLKLKKTEIHLLKDNYEIFHIPIGDEEFIKNDLRDHLLSLKRRYHKLNGFQKHYQWAYYYWCINYSTVVYKMRSIEPKYLSEYETALNSWTKDIIKFMSEFQEEQIHYDQNITTLSIKLGGLGMKALKDHKVAAYTSSLALSLDNMVHILSEELYQQIIEQQQQLLHTIHQQHPHIQFYDEQQHHYTQKLISQQIETGIYMKKWTWN